MKKITTLFSLLIVTAFAYSQGQTFSKNISGRETMDGGSYSYSATFKYKLVDAGYGNSPTALMVGIVNSKINEITYKGYKASEILDNVSFPVSSTMQTDVNGQVNIKSPNGSASVFTNFSKGQIRGGGEIGLSTCDFSSSFRQQIFFSFW